MDCRCGVLDYLRLRDLYELLEALSRGSVRTVDIPPHSLLEHLNYLIKKTSM